MDFLSLATFVPLYEALTTASKSPSLVIISATQIVSDGFRVMFSIPDFGLFYLESISVLIPFFSICESEMGVFTTDQVHK